MELLDNWWLPHYIVGTTEIHRTDIQPEGSTRPGEIHHTSSYVHPSDEEEESASRAKYMKREKEKKAERAYINSLMTGGMTSIQGHMTSQQEQEIKKERDHYKKKAERLEKKYGKKLASRASTPGSPSGSDDSGYSRSNLFDSGDPSEPDTADNEVLERYKHKLEGAKGPKMKIPETFTGDRTDVTRFIRQCQVYFITKRKEFGSEMEKMLWITSLCDGEAVEGWVDWITSMLNEKNEKAPKKASEMLMFLNTYFGDPDKVSTARHKLDQLKQTRRMEEYVVTFQSIAYKTKYTEAELEHRFVVGLKQEIRDKCLAAYPRPEGLGEWISRAYALQHAFDLNVNYSRAAQPSNTYQGRMPGRLAPQAQARYPYRKPYNPPDYQQTFNRPQAAPQSQPQTNAQPAQKADRSR